MWPYHLCLLHDLFNHLLVVFLLEPNPTELLADCTFESGLCDFASDVRVSTPGWFRTWGATVDRDTGPISANGGGGYYVLYDASDNVEESTAT